MALLFMDGFDAGDYVMKWTATSVNGTSAVTPYSQGLSLYSASAAGGYVWRRIEASTYVYMGFALKFSSADCEIIQVYGDNASLKHVAVATNSDGTVSILVGSTVVATSTSILNWSVWNYIEFSASISDTTGTASLRVHGVEIVSYAGDTKNGGTNDTIDAVRIQRSVGKPAFYIDDFYVCNDTGAAPYNTFLGDTRVYTMTPSAAGNSTQFTPLSGDNYTNVDELPYSAADYVSSPTSGAVDTYTLTDLPATATTVYGVQHNVIARKGDAGEVSLKPVIRSGGANYSPTATPLVASDVAISELYEQDPATAAAWTVANVNALESGMEVG